MRPWIFLLFLLCLAGCTSIAVSSGDAAAVAAAVMAIDSGTPTTPPPVAPVNGVCPNCNGRGKVGDSRVMLTCPVCKGTGKVGSVPKF